MPKDTAPLQDLDDDDFVVVDMATGTVLGTDLRLVRLADLDADTSLEDMLSSDSFAADVAGQHGTDLLVEL